MHRPKKLSILLLPFLIPAWNVQGNEFISLGFLSSESDRSWSVALSVNATGSAVVGRSRTQSGSTAFIWRADSSMRQVSNTQHVITANAISADGTTVVGRATSSQMYTEPFIWSESTGLRLLGNLTLDPVGGQADDVSDDGSVVVGVTSTSQLTSFEAFRWTAHSGMVGLGHLPGGFPVSVALAVSGDGKVIVGQSDSANGSEAFRWNEVEGMVGIGDLPGGEFQSLAYDVSANGQVIIGTGFSSTIFEEAFRWDSVQGMIGLGHLPDTYNRSFPLGISPDGNVIVGESGLAQDELKAFVWDSRRGMLSLQDVLETEFGLAEALAGWKLATAYDISANGRAIVGWGYNPERKVEAWLVRLDRPIGVPEPTALALLFTAALVASCKRLRRARAKLVGAPHTRRP
jgi:probable HAF family extracellular repeat protein